jgi:hypothetical protein
MEPHDMAIVAVEDSVQPVQDALGDAIVMKNLAFRLTCVEESNSDRDRRTLDGAHEGVENSQSVLERFVIACFSWVY